MADALPAQDLPSFEEVRRQVPALASCWRYVCSFTLTLTVPAWNGWTYPAMSQVAEVAVEGSTHDVPEYEWIWAVVFVASLRKRFPVGQCPAVSKEWEIDSNPCPSYPLVDDEIKSHHCQRPDMERVGFRYYALFYPEISTDKRT